MFGERVNLHKPASAKGCASKVCANLQVCLAAAFIALSLTSTGPGVRSSLAWCSLGLCKNLASAPVLSIESFDAGYIHPACSCSNLKLFTLHSHSLRSALAATHRAHIDQPLVMFALTQSKCLCAQPVHRQAFPTMRPSARKETVARAHADEGCSQVSYVWRHINA